MSLYSSLKVLFTRWVWPESDAVVKKHLRTVIKQHQEDAEQTENIPAAHECKKEEPFLPSDKPYSQIIYTIDINNQVSIQFKWSEVSKATAECLGTMLYALNSGNLTQQSEMILSKTMEQSPEHRPFIESIFESWQSAINRHEQVVKPSEVFKLGRQSMDENRQRSQQAQTQYGDDEE